MASCSYNRFNISAILLLQTLRNYCFYNLIKSYNLNKLLILRVKGQQTLFSDSANNTVSLLFNCELGITTDTHTFFYIFEN